MKSHVFGYETATLELTYFHLTLCLPWGESRLLQLPNLVIDL